MNVITPCGATVADQRLHAVVEVQHPEQAEQERDGGEEREQAL